VVYWHVELDRHDILLAEGLPAESFHGRRARDWFDAAATAAASVEPDFIAADMPGRCRPVAIEGLAVDAERGRLDATFAAELAAHSRWPGAQDRMPGWS